MAAAAILTATSQARAESAFTYDEMYKQSIEEFTDVINDELDKYDLNGIEVDERCSKFMDAKMVLGPQGQYIKSEIVKNPKKYPFLIESTEMKNLCPQYSTMNVNDRAFVWTLVLTAMAHLESNCNSKVTAKGPNGTAAGFYQLHWGKEDYYDGENSTCFKNSGKDPQGSSRCALSMLDNQMKNFEGKLFVKKSYWDVLRPNGAASRSSKAPQKIKKALVNHKACQ